ncbi:calmodulin-A-like [Lytechinus pictus]|uniref:calmodulin-A-like n=1 Tax=Lytechinus pictus TaxID=7653 RepID=UPI0030B9B752
MASSLFTAEEIENYRRTFSSFYDSNGDGFITSEELGAAMEQCGCGFTEEEIKEMVTKADTTNDGKIDFEEFLMMMARTQAESTYSEEDIRGWFKTLDKDDNGCISAKEMREALGEFCISMSKEKADQLIKESDKNGDGLVNYEEFVQTLMVLKLPTS